VIHRTLLGSMERFIGGLIEHYGGAFPLWLAPEQVRILPVSEPSADEARSFVAELKSAGIRASLDDRDTLGYRIRSGETQKLPYLGIIGEREADTGAVAVRKRGAEEKQVVMDRSAFIERLHEEVRTRSLI
ncbi:MAG: His/Gly/Thr/Pro-type tRNA ligase C-terminal domain-containing protein, partial [Gemmatimonadota bacterium]|nr:His/Gly/Thr/Pro-type tRNA ligase C-terminal domain-containing protein [Gemmatimonadota bacterium]